MWQMTFRILTMAAFTVYGELPEADAWTDYCYNLWLARFDGSWLVPVNYGTTTLTADCGGFTAQCTVTVVRPED